MVITSSMKRLLFISAVAVWNTYSLADDRHAHTDSRDAPYVVQEKPEILRSKLLNHRTSKVKQTHLLTSRVTKHNFKAKLTKSFLRDSPDTDFVCPEGYKKRKSGAHEFCTPTLTEKDIAREKIDCTDGQVGCTDTKRELEPKTCPDGYEVVESEDRVQGIEHSNDNVVKCTHGSRLVHTENGTKCQPIPLSEQITDDIFISNPLFDDKHSIPLKSELKEHGKGSKLECDGGKVAAMSENGYICVDPVFPTSVCPENLVPSMSSRGIQCVPCPSGQKVIHTENGVQCESVTMETTDISCPEGLNSVQTSVGIICQYQPNFDAKQVPICPDGHRIEYKDGQIGCYQDMDCPPGYRTEYRDGQMLCFQDTVCAPGLIEVYSEDGITHCEAPDITDHSACLDDEVLVEGACISIRLAEKVFGAQPGPCQDGEELEVTQTGSFCRPGTETRVQGGHNTHVSKSCGFGTIITQTLDGFHCLAGEIPPEFEIMCEQEYVLAKVGDSFECISVYDADLLCTGGQMVPADGRFSCEDVPQEVHCSDYDFYHTDHSGRTSCLSLQEASEMCGEDYGVVRHGHSFLCRKRIENLSCPDGFELTIKHGEPLCIQPGDDCLEITGVEAIGCMDQAPYCQPGYTIHLEPTNLYCMLEHLIEQPIHTDTGTEPCGSDGNVRPCDLPAELLLAGCNPDCANGGTCINSTCSCPPGITGHACHIDINECDTQPCDYECENTFGSYRCACPRGMVLGTDGQSCTDVPCIPACLNNGDCIRGQCRCTSGFEGQYCQNDIDECMKYGDRLCQHQCRNTHGGYTCICPPGSRLNQDARTCLNTTCIPECRNGGSCRNHRCHCLKGFYGIICQFDINECRKSDSCDQNCVNTWGSFSCSCNKGFVMHTDGRTCVRV